MIGGGRPSHSNNQNNPSQTSLPGPMSTHRPPNPNLPVDLNNLINFTQTFETLKDALEYLANTQQDHSNLMSQIIS